MTQNINLLDPGMRQARPRLSFVLLGKCLAGLVVPMLVVYVFLQFQLSSLNGELRRAQELLTTEQAEAQKLAAQGARKPDPQVESEIARMQGELRQAQDTVQALKGSGFGERQGFAEYLRAFSRQSVEGLWLTAFTITGAGELELSGRALRADLVPAYIQRLSGEDVLTGRTFARFEMNRPAADAAADKKLTPLAPYLEFTLATRETVKMAEKPQ